MFTKNYPSLLTKLTVGSFGLLLGVGASSAQAQVLVDYPFTTAGSYAPSIVDPSVASTTLDISNLNRAPVQSDLANGVAIELYPFSSGPAPYTSGGTSDAAALAIPTFFADTLTAASGSFLNIGQIQFQIGPGGASTPRGYDLRTSVDNYSSSLSEVDSLPPATPTTPTNVSVFTNANPSYQHLSSITIRVYVFSPTPASNSIDMKNFIVTASPEPGDFALLLVGALPLIVVARRRKH